MSAHVSEAFSTAHCTDSEDLPCVLAIRLFSYHQLDIELRKLLRGTL